jgi:hypothetical protein
LPVFVSVKPDSDSGKNLLDFGEMFEPRGSKQLVLLRAKNNQSENLRDMMRRYKVPIGLTPEEQSNLD